MVRVEWGQPRKSSTVSQDKETTSGKRFVENCVCIYNKLQKKSTPGRFFLLQPMIWMFLFYLKMRWICLQTNLKSSCGLTWWIHTFHMPPSCFSDVWWYRINYQYLYCWTRFHTEGEANGEVRLCPSQAYTFLTKWGSSIWDGRGFINMQTPLK